MFLAWKEIKRSKGKFSLIVIMVALISYLVFFLTSLAYGLASSYTAGLDSWNASSIVLTADSNNNAMMSAIDDTDYDAIAVSGEKARLGILPAVIRDSGSGSAGLTDVYVFGIEPSSFIAPPETPAAGLEDSQTVADISLMQEGYEVGSKLALAGSQSIWTIIGFTSKSTYQTAPVLYVNLATWRQLRSSASDSYVSAAVVRGSILSLPSGLTSYTISEYAFTLPGYSAQVATFSLMIGFLIVIASFVLGIFMYVLTLQKTGMFGVMKAQGVSNGFLSGSVLAQTLILTFLGLAAGFLFTYLSGIFLQGRIPFAYNYLYYAGITLGFFVFAILGSLFSVRAVLKINPLKAIG